MTDISKRTVVKMVALTAVAAAALVAAVSGDAPEVMEKSSVQGNEAG